MDDEVEEILALGSSGPQPTESKGSWIKGAALSAGASALGYVQGSASWLMANGGYWLWVVGTTGVVVLLPLVAEIAREGDVIALEQLQSEKLMKEGVPIQQLQQQGMAVPVEPSVLQD